MIRPLTSLRFIFALMVFVSHLGFLVDSDYPIFRWLFLNVFKEGYIGVSFFFILSGFILSHNYYDVLLKGTERLSHFFIKRIMRIYPLHLLTLLAAIPLSLSAEGVNLIRWSMKLLANLSLTQSFVPYIPVYYAFNGPSWSISNEMFFYLMFPFIIKWLASVYKKIGYRICLCGLGFGLIPVLMFFIPPPWDYDLFYIHPFFRLADFMLGICIQRIQKAFEARTRKVKLSFNTMEASSICIMALFFLFHQYVPKVVRFSCYYWPPMCCMLLAFSFQGGWVSRILSHRYLMKLGNISFAFYLTHQLVLRYLNFWHGESVFLDTDLIRILISLGISIPLSFALFHGFEKPINRYVKKRLRGWTPLSGNRWAF